jgi:uncharacterized membrane protein
MNVNLEYSKTLAGEGSILLLLTIIPYVGWVLGIIGVVLLVRSMKEFSIAYQDERIYQETMTGVKFYIIAIIAAAVGITAITLGAWSATHFTDIFTFTAGFGAGLTAFIAAIVIAFVFFVLAASHLKTVFSILAQKSGESSFDTAGTLLWIGSILTIVFFVGLLLIFVAWIFSTIGFFSIKPRQYQQYTPQAGGYTQPPPQQATNTQTGSGTQ